MSDPQAPAPQPGPRPGPPGPPPATPPPGAEPSVVLLGVEEPRPRRSGLRIALVAVAVLVLGLSAALVPFVVDNEPPNLSEVRVYEGLSLDHTDDDVDYPQSPPVGGPHADAWLECGVYEEPVREENLVHDLEHGTVVISYRLGLDGDDVALLAEKLPQNGILAPYPDLAAEVVVTVWGHQLRLDGADDPRLDLFIQRYAGGATAPEPNASCAGGLTDPAGDPPGLAT